jgi:thiol-disulfide isomerase/thioredoxin
MEMDMRQYDPAIGRWTSIDPVVHHSMSTYTAFDNNPIYWADPSGADSWKYVEGGNGLYRNDQTGEKTYDYERAISETQSHLGESSSNDNNYDCPKCDNENIILDFVETAAVENGGKQAEAKIRRAKSYHTEEDDFLDDTVIYGSLVSITGKELKYKKKWYNFMSGGRNTYDFDQIFEINGNKYSAKATIHIYENDEDNNLSSMSFPITSKDYVRGTQNVIRFYNTKGNMTINLTFKNQRELRAFSLHYYEVNKRRTYYSYIREYKNPGSVPKIKL